MLLFYSERVHLLILILLSSITAYPALRVTVALSAR